MLRKRLISVLLSALMMLSLIPLASPVVHAAPTTYYIDTAGSNANNGTTTGTAWADFTNVNSLTFQPGDKILLKAGCTWNQEMILAGNGTSGSFIEVDQYGTGSKPKIDRGNDVNARAMWAQNVSYWKINNLEICNAAMGIRFHYTTKGNKSIYFQNLYIHNVDLVYASVPASTVASNSPGIFISSYQTPPTSQGNYIVDDVRITNCEIDYTTCPIGFNAPYSSGENAWAFSNVLIDSNQIHNFKLNLYLCHMNNSTFSNNNVTDGANLYAPYGTTGVWLWRDDTITISNNYFDGIPDTGSYDQCWIDFEGYCKNCTVSGNTFKNTAGAGIEFLSLGTNPNLQPPRGPDDFNTGHLVQNNTFYNNGHDKVTSNGASCIWVSVNGTAPIPGGTIRDNYYKSGDTFFTGPSSGFTILNNNATGSTDTTAPSAPTNLTSPSKTDTTVALTWTASTDNVGVTSYDVYRSSTLVGSTSSTSFTVSSLSPNTAYSFTVKAKDAAGNASTASNTCNVTTNTSSDVTAPTAPGSLTSPGKTDTTVSLSWAASSDAVGVTAYDVYKSSTKIGTVGGSTLNFNATGLLPNTAYSFTVKARDAAGNTSSASNTCNVTTNASAGTDIAPSATLSASETDIVNGYSLAGAVNGDTSNWAGWASCGTTNAWFELDWASSQTISQVDLYSTDGYLFAGYKIQTWNGSAWVDQATTGNTTKLKTTTFTPVSTTKLRIYGTSGDMYGFYRIDEIKVYQTSAPVPDAFAITAPLNNATGVSKTPAFSWNASPNSTSYTLVVSTNSSLSSPIINQSGLTTTSYTSATTLSEGTVYYWKVTAVNSYGSTDATNSVFKFTTQNGAPIGTTNIAPSATLSASETDTVNGYSTAEAVDGNTNDWAGWSSKGTTNAWFELDWASAKNIAQVNLYSTTGYLFGGYKIQTWNGSAWVDQATTGNTAKLKTTTFTPVSTSKLRIYGTSGDAYGIYRIDEIQVYESNASSPPGAFTLGPPLSGATGVSTTPTFNWGTSPIASTYTLVVSVNSNLSSPIINQSGITGTSYTPGSALSNNTLYYWKVTAVNSYGSTDASNSNFTFTTQVATSANLLSNPGFESGTTSWTAQTCSIATNASAHSGSYSCLASSRTQTWGSPKQDIKSILLANGQNDYTFSFWAKFASGSDVLKIVINTNDSNGDHWFYDSLTVGTTFTQVTATKSITWTGTLNSATIYAQSGTVLTDLYVDDFSLIYGGTGTDTQAPTAPTGLTSPSKTDTSVNLSWTASSDNVGVTSYDVYNGSTFAGSTTTTSFSVTGLSPSTAYTFTVKARDAVNNASAASVSLNVTTNASGGANLLSNPGFESGTTSWTAQTCSIATNASSHSGSYACLASSRTANYGSPKQDIKTILTTNGQGNYTFSTWAKVESGSEGMRVVIKTNDSGGDHYFYCPITTVGTTYTQLITTQNITWTGTLNSALIYVTTGTTVNVYVDDFSLTKV